MKKLIILPFICFCISAFAQKADFKGKNPLFVLDGRPTTREALDSIKPSEIASVTILKDTAAMAIYGTRAADGVILITSIKAAREEYWKFLCSKSAKYARLVPSPEEDNDIQYVLNGKLITKHYNQELMSINNRNFKSIEVINKAALISKYDVHDKTHGVIIETIKVSQKPERVKVNK
jgi:TonB-dependent SusC/RagA subfamily outer membrane receptor